MDVLCSGRASPYPQLYDPYTDVEPVAGYEKLMPCRSVDAISPGSKEHYHRFSCRLTPNGSAQRRLLGAEYAHRLHLQLKYGWSWLRLPRRPGDGTTPRAAPHEVQIPEWPSLSSLVQQLLYYSHMEGERCDEFISLCKVRTCFILPDIAGCTNLPPTNRAGEVSKMSNSEQSSTFQFVGTYSVSVLDLFSIVHDLLLASAHVD